MKVNRYVWIVAFWGPKAVETFTWTANRQHRDVSRQVQSDSFSDGINYAPLGSTTTPSEETREAETISLTTKAFAPSSSDFMEGLGYSPLVKPSSQATGNVPASTAPLIGAAEFPSGSTTLQRDSIHSSSFDDFGMMGTLNRPMSTSGGSAGSPSMESSSSQRMDNLGMLGTVSGPLSLDGASVNRESTESSRLDTLGLLGTPNEPLELDETVVLEPVQPTEVHSLGMLGEASRPLLLDRDALPAEPSQPPRMDTIGMLGTASEPLVLDETIEVEPAGPSRMDSIGMLGDVSQPIESEPPVLDAQLDSLGMLGEVSKPIESEPPVLEAQLDSLGMLGVAGVPLTSVSPDYVPPLQESLGMLGEVSKPLTTEPPATVPPSRVESLGLTDTPPKQPLTFVPTTIAGNDPIATAPTGTVQEALVDTDATYGDLYKSRSANVVASASVGKSRWGEVENQKATRVAGVSLDTPPAPPQWDASEPLSSDPLYEFGRQMDDMKRRLEAVQKN